MKKSLIKHIVMLALFLILMTCTAFAEEKEEWLYNNPKQQSLMVVISYEKDDVKISFKDPSGKVIKLDSLKSEKIDNTLYVYIENAAAGQWNLIYDKGTNESIKASAYPAESSMTIKGFKTGKVADSKIPVEFSVTGINGGYYSYEISIGMDETFESARVLKTGSVYGEDVQSVEVPLDGINDGNYYLRIYAYYEDGEAFDFDEAISGSFSVVNTEKVDALEDYDVTVNLTEKTLDVSFEYKLPWDVVTVCVKAEADGTEIFEEFLDVESSEYTLSEEYEGDPKEIKISASLQYSSGRVSEETVKTVYLDTSGSGFAVELPESGTINNNKYSFKYANAHDQLINIKINDEYPTEETLDGKGKKSIELPDNGNDVLLSYIFEGVTYVTEQYIVVDIYPPSLKLYENLDGMTTSEDKVIVTGKTDVGSILTINDEEVELDDNGSFSYEFALEDGTNVLTVNSEDEAGNIATYAMKINKAEPSSEVGNLVKGETASKILGFLPLFIALFVSLFGILELATVSGGKKKQAAKVDTVRKASIILLIFSGIAFIFDLVLFIVRRNYEKSEEYIDLALDFPKKAYEYLQTTKTCKTLLYVLGAVAVVALLAVIISVIVKKFNDPGRVAAKQAAKEEARRAKEAAAQAKAAEAQAKAQAKAAEAARMQAEKEAKAKAEMEARAAAERDRIRRMQEAAQAAANQPTAPVQPANQTPVQPNTQIPAQPVNQTPVQPVNQTPVAPAPDQVSAGSAPTFKFCTNCGNKLPLGTKFCTKCGKPQ